MMKSYRLITIAAAMLIVVGCGCTKNKVNPVVPPEPEPEDIPIELNLASFNIRLDTSSDTEYKDWQARKANCMAVVRTHDFDVFGLQEVLANQQNNFKEMLPLLFTSRWVARKKNSFLLVFSRRRTQAATR